MIRRESLVRARLGLSCQFLSTELSSYLTRLLCPVFRPVNIQVQSQQSTLQSQYSTLDISTFNISTVNNLTVNIYSLRREFSSTKFSPQLYSEKEKQSKEDLLSLMTCYDLQFVQHRSVEGLSQYLLEPDVYSLTRFTGLPEVKQLPYSVKQMLAREVSCEGLVTLFF